MIFVMKDNTLKLTFLLIIFLVIVFNFYLGITFIGIISSLAGILFLYYIYQYLKS